MMKKIAFYLMAAVLLFTACNDELETSSPVIGVTISESAVMLKLGEKVIVSAIVDPAGASNVLWTSCDETIATVDQFGGITAIGEGTTSIIATTTIGRKIASCAVYVNAIRTERIELDKPALYLLPEDTAPLTATVFPADATNKTVIWTSSDEKVATIKFLDEEATDKAQVLATGFGNATITAMTEDGEFKAYCLVTVSKISVTGLLLTETTVEGVCDDTFQLHATILPDNATFPEIIWTSSDEAMATVDGKGLVTIVSKEAGTAVIRATSKDNNIFWAECVVNILKDESGISEITVWEGSVDIDWWPNIVEIDKSKFADVPAGSLITFYFEQKTDWGQVKLCDGSWAELSFAELGGGGTFTTNTVNDKSATSIGFTLTQALLDKLTGSGMIIQGDKWIMKKVTVTVKVASETIVYEGNTPFGTSWGTWVDLSASAFANAKVGQAMVFDVKFDTNDTWAQFLIQNSNWSEISGTKTGVGASDTSKEIVLTQNMLTTLQSGTSHLGGYNCTVTKITIR